MSTKKNPLKIRYSYLSLNMEQRDFSERTGPLSLALHKLSKRSQGLSKPIFVATTAPQKAREKLEIFY